MAWSKMRPANGIVVLADSRVNPGFAVVMYYLVLFKANVRSDEVLLGLGVPLSARG